MGEWTPSQGDVDAVAYFMEAVDELRRSPFFIEEYRNLSIVWTDSEGMKDVRGRFPDPAHVAAMLIPFRRIWQQGEPCNYRRVANIIKRAQPDGYELADSFLFSDKSSAMGAIPFLRSAVLKPTDAINLWINTRYMHTGRSATTGTYTRQDFERIASEMGIDLFEYYFLTAVNEAGISFINLSMLAKLFLAECAKKGLRPSFALHAQSNGSPERTTPGFPVPADTPEHRVWRLKRRNRYEGLAKFINMLSFSDGVVAEAMTYQHQFDEFVNALGIRLEQMDTIKLNEDGDITHFTGAIDAQHTVVRNRKARRGFIGKRRDGSFVWREDYLPILRDQYLEFREAFLRHPFA